MRGAVRGTEIEESFWEEGMRGEEVELARQSTKGASLSSSMGWDPWLASSHETVSSLPAASLYP